jgi:hypothetical protein
MKSGIWSPSKEMSVPALNEKTMARKLIFDKKSVVFFYSNDDFCDSLFAIEMQKWNNAFHIYQQHSYRYCLSFRILVFIYLVTIHRFSWNGSKLSHLRFHVDRV